MFEDPKFVSALEAGIVSLIVATGSFLVAAATFRTKILETSERTLIQERLKVYPELMADLKPLAFNSHFKDMNYDGALLKKKCTLKGLRCWL